MREKKVFAYSEGLDQQKLRKTMSFSKKLMGLTSRRLGWGIYKPEKMQMKNSLFHLQFCHYQIL